MPPETQEGRNTFGCLVNGEVFKPKGNILNPTLTCYYQYIYPSPIGYVFSLSAKNNSEDSLRWMAINIDSVKLTEGMTIKLGGLIGRAGAQYNGGHYDRAYRYYTINGYEGLLNLKKFDEVNQIVAGTFWFKAVNSFGDTISVTDGRFDLKYTR